MADRCDQYPKCKEEAKEIIEFRAVVLTKLDNIFDVLAEEKSDTKKDREKFWEAIDDIRNTKVDKTSLLASITILGILFGIFKVLEAL